MRVSEPELNVAQSHDPAEELSRLRAELEETRARLAAEAERHRRESLEASLKLAALSAGMIDPDGVKLIDPTPLLEAEDRDKAIAAAMETLRARKPWLFGAPSTAPHHPAPPPEPPRPRHAREMTREEYERAKAELLRRL
jgi:hypothetical protein